jgi:hypothetical protein
MEANIDEEIIVWKGDKKKKVIFSDSEDEEIERIIIRKKNPIHKKSLEQVVLNFIFNTCPDLKDINLDNPDKIELVIVCQTPPKKIE